MSAGTVTLDLNALSQVLGTAVRVAKDNLYRDMTEIQNDLEASARAGANGDWETHYRKLCNANTHREYVVSSAKQYADAVEAYFHVCEAIKREEVEIVKEGVK